MKERFLKGALPRMAVEIPLVALALVFFLGKGDQISLRGRDSNIHASAAIATAAARKDVRPAVPAPALAEYSWGGVGARRSAEMAERLRQVSGFSAPAIYNDHPVILFLLQGWSMKLFGRNAWSARLPTALFSVGTVLVVYALGAAYGSSALGLVAALLLMLTRNFIQSSASASLDPPLVFVTLLAFLLWKQRSWKAGALVAGLGFWIKTPVSLLVLPAMFLVEARRDFRGAVQRYFLGLVLALCVGAVYWLGISLYTGSFDTLRDYFLGQMGGVMTGAVEGSFRQPLGFPLHILLVFWPWLPLAVWAPVQALRTKRLPPVLPVVGAALLVLAVVFGLMKTVLAHYYLPAFPFLCLAAALPLEKWVQAREEVWVKGIWVAALVTALLAGVTPLSFGPEPFPALRRFAPYIDVSGDCTDRLVWVPGGEPLGDSLDAIYWLNFMTGREVVTAECSALSSRTQDPRVVWVVLANVNQDECSRGGGLRDFAPGLRFEGQTLYFRKGRGAWVGDLAPLRREGQASVTCPRFSFRDTPAP